MSHGTKVELRVPFGLLNGRMVAVENVERGAACDCICPKCATPLIAAKGDIYRHHFRHLAEDCGQARETALHMFAKQIICERLTLALPCPLSEHENTVLVRAEAEYHFENLIPDVMAWSLDQTEVAIEVWVAHQVGDEKIRDYNRSQIAAVEIDLRDYRFADKTLAEWEDAVLHLAPRKWLSDPQWLRAAKERKRQAEMAQMREVMWLETKRLEELQRRHRQEQKHLAQLEQMYAQQRAAAVEEELKRAALAAEERTKQDRVRQARLAEEKEAQQRALLEQQQANAIAEQERAKNAAVYAVMEARLKAEMTPPSVQNLIAVHGSWDRITDEAWAQYDSDLKQWQIAVASGQFSLPPYSRLRK